MADTPHDPDTGEVIPDRMGGLPMRPTPFADLPKPPRKGDASAAVPFDPMGYQTFQSLQEVMPKPQRNEDTQTAGQIAAARRKMTFVPKFPTLESMYANHPELMRVGQLRIERVQPQWCDDAYGQKVRVCGTLAFRHPCVSSEDFARMFGGFRFRAYGLLEQENKENHGGPPQPVEVAVAEFELPLPPNLDNLPVADLMGESEPSAMPFGATMFVQSPYGRRPGNGGPFMAGMPGMPTAFVQAAAPGGSGLPVEPVLQFASRAMDRATTQQQQPMSDAFWHVVGKQTEVAQENLRRVAEQNSSLLQAQNEQLFRQLEAERARAQEIASRPPDMVQMIKGVAELTQAQKGGLDSDALRQMRDDHERQLRHMIDEHERSIARVREEADRVIKTQRDDFERLSVRERETQELKMRYSEDRVKELQLRLESREREYREEWERRERLLRDEFQRAFDAKEREYTARLSEIKDVHHREMASLKDMHERELRMREHVQQTTVQTSEKAHEIEMRSLTKDLAKLSGELSEKSRMVEQHMNEKNKPLLEQVRELQEMTAAIQEMAGGSTDDETAALPPGGDKWYNSPLFQEVAKVAIAKGAELLPKLAEAAAEKTKPAPAAQMGPAMMGPAMAPLPQGAPVGGLPPRRRRKMTFADSEGPPLRDPYQALQARYEPGDIAPKASGPRQFTPDAPMMDYGPVAGQPMQYQQQYAPVQQPAAVAQPAASVAAEPQQAPAQAVQAQEEAEPVEAQEAGLQSSEADWSAFDWMPMSPTDRVNFLTQLNEALVNGIPPGALVEAFCKEYPMAVVSQLPAVLPVEKLIDSIRKSPATSRMKLSSGTGRRFIADVWQQLNRRVEEWKASLQEPTAAPAPRRGRGRPAKVKTPEPEGDDDAGGQGD